jgi:DNA-binding LacI/PurR family transcriptional regulator
MPPRLGHGCFRAYKSLDKAARMSLDILHAAGHRSIALVTNKEYDTAAWLAARRNVLLDQARSYKECLTVFDIIMSDPPGISPKNQDLLGVNIRATMLERIENIRKSRGDFPVVMPDKREAVKRQLAKEQPELEKLVAQRRHTAVIAANDIVAADFVTWMNNTGRSVPRDMSLISYDNHPMFSLHRFSSIDMGLADLGYLVAHRFIGDIPVQKDANGNITVTPRLFDRGSISAPAKVRLRR